MNAILVAALVAAGLPPFAAAARAQEVTGPAVMAAVVANIAKFTTWPAAAFAAGPDLVFCVAGDPAIHDALERLTRGREIEGRSVDVRAVPADGPFDGCHVLHLAGMSLARATQAAGTVAERPILTVSDIRGFSHAGGITLLYFRQSRVAFHIDVDAMRRSGIEISSRVLILSKEP